MLFRFHDFEVSEKTKSIIIKSLDVEKNVKWFRIYRT